MSGYEGLQGHMADPAEHAFAITPADGADLPQWSLALYVGSAGDVKLDTWGGETVTFASVPVGILPVRARRVYATGTTASSIVGLY